MTDYTCRLPDDCLAVILNFLTTTKDRNNSSLVSHRWLRIEAQTRKNVNLSLNPISGVQRMIPSIFNRFNSLTQLVIGGFPLLYVIHDEDLILITSLCPNLTCLRLRLCLKITDSGMAVFSKNCKKLKIFSCLYCSISDLGIHALLVNCSQLEVLSFKPNKSSLADVGAPFKFCTGLTSKTSTLKVIKLQCVHIERLFEPLIIGSKNLKTLKAIDCHGNWDRCFEMIPDDNCLVEVHLEECNVTDVGFSSLSKCRDLISLHIDSSQCTDVGLICVAEKCKGLKKLYVGNRISSDIGDKGLIAVGKHSVNLQELILVGVKASCVSLEVIATNCERLVRLGFNSCWTITDAAMMCIAEKCVALRTLFIEDCRVTNKGIEAFAVSNMVDIRVSKCKWVARKIKKWLKARKKLIADRAKAVNDVASDGGVQEHVVKLTLAMMVERQSSMRARERYEYFFLGDS